MARLILDTGVLVAGARGRLNVAALADTDDVTIPAVAVAEYLAGTLLDQTPDVPPLKGPSWTSCWMWSRCTGTTGPWPTTTVHCWLMSSAPEASEAHDLIIAATARAAESAVLTTDERARFKDLPEVSVRIVDS